MGLVVLVLTLPIIIPIMIIGFIIMYALDNNSKKSRRRNYYSYRYYDDYDDYNDYHPEPEEVHHESEDSVFDGGIPMGDSTLYLTDDDDFVDELGDAFI